MVIGLWKMFFWTHRNHFLTWNDDVFHILEYMGKNTAIMTKSRDFFRFYGSHKYSRKIANIDYFCTKVSANESWGSGEHFYPRKFFDRMLLNALKLALKLRRFQVGHWTLSWTLDIELDIVHVSIGLDIRHWFGHLVGYWTLNFILDSVGHLVGHLAFGWTLDIKDLLIRYIIH